MNHSEYISQIEIILKNLNDNLDKIYAEITHKNDSITSLLGSKIVTNLSEVEKLENQYRKSDEDNSLKISQLKSVIIHLEEELQKAITEYDNTHNSVMDKEVILSQKDEVLNETISLHKKTIAELKQKISTLDRECILNLKAKLVEFEEESNIFKNKVNDIEKRMKFEVGKIENEILTPTINVDPNSESQSYVNSKELREYRVKGINEIASIKQKYYKDIRDLEIKFYKLEAEYDKDNKILREEYNLQIEELKYEIIKVERSIKVLLDEYDFNCYKTVNNNELTYQTRKIEISREQNSKINEYIKKIKDQDSKANTSWLTESVDVFNTISSLDNKVNKSWNEYNLDNLKDLKTISNHVVESMKKTVEIFVSLFTKILNSQLKSSSKLTEDFLNGLIISTYKSYNFKDFNYDTFNEELRKLIVNYNNKRESNLSNFINLQKDSITNLLNQLKVISTNFDNYISEEIKTINASSNSFESLFTKAALAGVESANLYYKTRAELTEGNFNNQNSKQKAIEDELNAKLNEANAIFKAREDELNSKANNNDLMYKQDKQKDLESFNQVISSINKNIKNAKNDYLLVVKNKKIEANKKYDTLVKEIKTDQKIKIKIGQI